MEAAAAGAALLLELDELEPPELPEPDVELEPFEPEPFELELELEESEEDDVDAAESPLFEPLDELEAVAFDESRLSLR